MNEVIHQTLLTDYITMVIISFPGEAVVKNLPASTGDTGDEG